MRVSYDIPYEAVEAVVAYLWFTHRKQPTKKEVISLLREMVQKGGECWLTEPTIDEDGVNAHWYEQNEDKVMSLAYKLHDSIY